MADAGEPDRALEWAEKGYRVCDQGREHDPRLVDFVVTEYQRRGRHADVLRLRWDAYERQPSFGAFQALKLSAEATGAWPATRERALAHLRATLRPAKGDGSWMQPGFDPLVEIFLSEDDLESAWREAVAGGAQPQIWLKLAGRLESVQPENAIEIYRRHVDRVVAAANNQAYAEAVDLLRIIRRLLGKTGREAKFPEMLADIRSAYRQKRNLMKMLVAEGW